MSSRHYKEYLGKRKGFEASKQTPTYKKWRAEQWRCQNGRCAWCYDKIDLYSTRTVTDHISPLYGFGDNDFQNLVLACWDCNQKKGKENGWKKPDWIKENKYTTKNYHQPSAQIDDPNPYIAERNIWIAKTAESEKAETVKPKEKTVKEKIEYFLMDLGVYSIGDFFALIFLLLFIVFPIIIVALGLLAWLFEAIA